MGGETQVLEPFPNPSTCFKTLFWYVSLNHTLKWTFWYVNALLTEEPIYFLGLVSFTELPRPLSAGVLALALTQQVCSAGRGVHSGHIAGSAYYFSLEQSAVVAGQ